MVGSKYSDTEALNVILPPIFQTRTAPLAAVAIIMIFFGCEYSGKSGGGEGTISRSKAEEVLMTELQYSRERVLEELSTRRSQNSQRRTEVQSRRSP